jgi:hypothetical protein
MLALTPDDMPQTSSPSSLPLSGDGGADCEAELVVCGEGSDRVELGGILELTPDDMSQSSSSSSSPSLLLLLKGLEDDAGGGGELVVCDKGSDMLDEMVLTGGEAEATVWEQGVWDGTEVGAEAEERSGLGDESPPGVAIARFSPVNEEEGWLEVGVTLIGMPEFDIGAAMLIGVPEFDIGAATLEGDGFEFDIEAEVDFRAEDGDTAGLPGTQPGTMSLGVAFSGPLVTATQPGRWSNTRPSPMPSSAGIGFFAAHDCIVESSSKRFSFLNTGQSSITPERLVHVSTARESTLLSQPFMKSPCNP